MACEEFYTLELLNEIKSTWSMVPILDGNSKHVAALELIHCLKQIK